MGKGRWQWVQLCVLSGALAALWAPHARGYAQDLSSEERSALSRGQLVTRESTARRGRFQLMGGTSYQVIDAPLSHVWATLLDTSSYPHMLPQVTRARLVSKRDGHRVVYFEQGAGPLVVSNYVELKIDEGTHEIGFHLDRTRDNALEAAYGLYTLRKYGKGRTLLVYAVMADIGDGLLKSLVRDAVHEWMLKVPWTIRGYIERKLRKERTREGKNAGATALGA